MINILIIDDTDFFRKTLALALRNKGYNIYEASNGIEGMKIINKNVIDLILIDVVMPEKGGIETLFEIQDKLSNTKVIIMTGKIPPNSDAFTILGENLGAHKILYKPFKTDELINTIEELLT